MNDENVQKMIDKAYKEDYQEKLFKLDIRATAKGFNPVYEDWIKKNKNNKLPRGKYFKKKNFHIIDIDPSIMNSLSYSSLVEFEYNPFNLEEK